MTASPSFSQISSSFQSYQDKVIKLLYEEFTGNYDIVEYFKKALLYNTENGKKIRGSLVVLSYSLYHDLEDKNSLKDEAFLIGWAIEILQASFLVLDDIIDDSKIRRGKPSWFVHQKSQGFGLLGVNDGMHLFICATKLIYKIFEDKMNIYGDICNDLVKLFTDVSYKTCLGQGLDGISALLNSPHDAPSPDKLFGKMNLETNRNIMLYKTSYYSFYLPIASALLLAGVKDANVFKSAEEISIKLGIYFQTQDDYLDAFGDEKCLGKEGTDIKEGKCTWLICKALSLADNEQKEILAENYGKDNKESVNQVKEIYQELKLSEQYAIFESDIREELFQLIKKHCDHKKNSHKDHPNHLFSEIFLKPMEILFKRSK